VDGYLFIGLLRYFCSEFSQILAVTIIVDIKMGRLDEIPIKVPVLDLVLTKGLPIET
jgi:hypothetical protein